MQHMTVVYRADGGHPVGSGHLARASRILWSLASRVRLSAHVVTCDPISARRIVRDAADVIACDGELDSTGTKPVFRARSIERLLASTECEIVIIDMLDTDAGEIENVQRFQRPIVTLDDRGSGRMKADAIINVLVDEPSPKSLSSRIRLHQGWRYAPLDPGYARPDAVRVGAVLSGQCRLLVTVGGVDAAGLAVLAARALARCREVRSAQFVVGSSCHHIGELRAAASQLPFPNAVTTDMPSLIPAFHDCDLAIVAGGFTMMEACRTGTPVIVFPQAVDHQVELGERLAAHGCAIVVDPRSPGGPASLAAIVDTLACAPNERTRMAQAGAALVDGWGIRRISDLLLEIVRPTEE